MSWVSDIHAGWIAIAAVVLAATAMGFAGLKAWRAYRSFSTTRSAAEMLLDVHTERLHETVVTAGSRAAHVGEHAGDAVAGIAELKTNVDHLGWMLAKVPTERDRLRTELLEIFLPTAGRSPERAPDDRDDASRD